MLQNGQVTNIESQRLLFMNYIFNNYHIKETKYSPMSYMNVVLEYISQNFFETDTLVHEYIFTIGMIFPQAGSSTPHNPQTFENIDYEQLKLWYVVSSHSHFCMN